MYDGEGWELIDGKTGATVIDRPFWIIEFQHGGTLLYSGRSKTPLSAPSNGIVLKINNKTFRVISSTTGTTPLKKSHVWGDFVTAINVRVEPK